MRFHEHHCSLIISVSRAANLYSCLTFLNEHCFPIFCHVILVNGACTDKDDRWQEWCGSWPHWQSHQIETPDGDGQVRGLEWKYPVVGGSKWVRDENAGRWTGFTCYISFHPMWLIFFDNEWFEVLTVQYLWCCGVKSCCVGEGVWCLVTLTVVGKIAVLVFGW